jgi:hypothetical protein
MPGACPTLRARDTVTAGAGAFGFVIALIRVTEQARGA